MSELQVFLEISVRKDQHCCLATAALLTEIFFNQFKVCRTNSFIIDAKIWNNKPSDDVSVCLNILSYYLFKYLLTMSSSARNLSSVNAKYKHQLIAIIVLSIWDNTSSQRIFLSHPVFHIVRDLLLLLFNASTLFLKAEGDKNGNPYNIKLFALKFKLHLMNKRDAF